MQRHAHVGVFRGDPRNQLRRIGVPWDDCLSPGFAFAQCLISEDKGDIIFLPDATVTRDTILIKDWPDISTEIHPIFRYSPKPWERVRQSPPSQKSSYRQQSQNA